MNAWSALGWSSNSRLAAAVNLLLLATLLAAVQPCRAGAAQHPASQSQPVPCATCHLGVSNNYSHSPMRHAMEPAGDNPVFAAHPALTARQNGYTYTIATRDGKSTYTVSDGSNSLTLPIDWMLGQHSQTWVLEKDGHFYESMVSYFHKDQQLATTPGDEQITPHTLEEAMGRQLSTWEVRNCFTCHASGYNPEKNLAGQKLTPGLDCDRCHEGSTRHMADAVQDNFKTLPRSLKKMDAGETAEFCGQCHRTWDRVVREGWHGPATVRFQPYRLENSRCFSAADRRISCLACHDPHRQADHSQAYYDTKCLACHAGAAAASTAQPKICPVAKKDCSTCHMPRVEIADGHAVFTDHQIRIVHPGDAYPN